VWQDRQSASVATYLPRAMRAADAAGTPVCGAPFAGAVAADAPVWGEPFAGAVAADAPVWGEPFAGAAVADAPVCDAPLGEAPVGDAPLGDAIRVPGAMPPAIDSSNTSPRRLRLILTVAGNIQTPALRGRLRSSPRRR
jgi:hypothetical protein